MAEEPVAGKNRVEDGPLTDDDAAAEQAGWDDYLRGDSLPLAEAMAAIRAGRRPDGANPGA